MYKTYFRSLFVRHPFPIILLRLHTVKELLKCESVYVCMQTDMYIHKKYTMCTYVHMYNINVSTYLLGDDNACRLLVWLTLMVVRLLIIFRLMK